VPAALAASTTRRWRPGAAGVPERTPPEKVRPAGSVDAVA